MPHLLLKDLPRYECLLEAAKEFPDLDPSAAEAFLHLLRTGDEAFGVTDRNLSDHSISHGRFGVLMLLWRSAQAPTDKMAEAGDCECGPRTPAELADAAGVTRATMTGLVDTLERDGFVKREPDPADRRTISVRLTDKGERFLNDFLPGHFKVITGLMAPLTESERKTLVRLLGKIQQQAAEFKPQSKVPRNKLRDIGSSHPAGEVARSPVVRPGATATPPWNSPSPSRSQLRGIGPKGSKAVPTESRF